MRISDDPTKDGSLRDEPILALLVSVNLCWMVYIVWVLCAYTLASLFNFNINEALHFHVLNDSQFSLTQFTILLVLFMYSNMSIILGAYDTLFHQFWNYTGLLSAAGSQLILANIFNLHIWIGHLLCVCSIMLALLFMGSAFFPRILYNKG